MRVTAQVPHLLHKLLCLCNASLCFGQRPKSRPQERLEPGHVPDLCCAFGKHAQSRLLLRGQRARLTCFPCIRSHSKLRSIIVCAPRVPRLSSRARGSSSAAIAAARDASSYTKS